MLHPLAFGMPGPFEMLVIAGLGLLIFGKRLPEVGRNIGKGIIEFKRGLKEAEDSITSDPPATTPAQQSSLPPAQSPQQIAAPKYKFDPYTGKPIEESSPTQTNA